MNSESSLDALLVNGKEGDPEAQFELGEYYCSEGARSIDEAVEWFSKAANQNHARAQVLETRICLWDNPYANI